jgi:hypothetical protein
MSAAWALAAKTAASAPAATTLLKQPITTILSLTPRLTRAAVAAPRRRDHAGERLRLD